MQYPPVSGRLGGVWSGRPIFGQCRRYPWPHTHWGVSQNASGETGPSTPWETPASFASSRSQGGGGLCYRGGSCTASLAPPEGAIPWILTISIWTPVPIIPHTWDWLIIHTCSSLTHTYKPHTHTDSLRSLDLPRLSFLSVIPMFDFCVLDLGPLACYSDCFLPAPTSDCFTWTVFASHLPWSSAWYSTLSLSIPCCSALPVFDPVLSDYSY